MIDAWIQHPTARQSGDPMFDSLRRWTTSDLDAVPTVANTVAALDAAAALRADQDARRLHADDDVAKAA